MPDRAREPEGAMRPRRAHRFAIAPACGDAIRQSRCIELDRFAVCAMERRLSDLERRSDAEHVLRARARACRRWSTGQDLVIDTDDRMLDPRLDLAVPPREERGRRLDEAC